MSVPSIEQCIRQCLMLEMGNCKPSQFLRQLRSLAPDMLHDFLLSIWSSPLSPNVQAILASQPEGDFNTTDSCADRIIEAATQPVLGHSPRATHFCSISRTSPARWQHSALSWPTFTLAPGTAAQATDPPPEMTLHPSSAGTTAAMELKHKSVLNPAPTASKENQHGEHLQHMSAPQPTAASSSRTGLVNNDS
jgi:hypothetical protein